MKYLKMFESFNNSSNNEVEKWWDGMTIDEKHEIVHWRCVTKIYEKKFKDHNSNHRESITKAYQRLHSK